MSQPANTSFEMSKLFYPLMIALGVFFVYNQTSSYDFVSYDDELYVSKNYRMKDGLTPSTFVWAFTTTEIANWHPLTWLSLVADYQFFGSSPSSFHSMNTFYHLLNSLLLYGLLLYATKAPLRCFLVAFLFAVHPLHAESVAWISGRKDVLSTLFGFLAIWSYFVYVKQKSIKWYACMLVCFSLSLLAKQMLVTLPFLLLLLDIWPLKRWNPGLSSTQTESLPDNPPTEQEPAPSFKKLFLEKTPLFGLTILFSILIYIVQGKGGAVQDLGAYSLSTRIQNAILSYGLYLKKTFYPHDLAVIYPHPGEAISTTSVLIAGAALLVLTGFAVLSLRKRPELFVGWFWYLGTLFPVIGIIQIGVEQMADRYSYVPQIGFLIFCAWLIPPESLSNSFRRTTCRVVALFVCLLALSSGHKQAAVWENTQTLMEKALSVNEVNPKAHNNLSTVFSNQGDFETAKKHLRRSIEIKPDELSSYLNMGNILRKEKRYPEAKKYYNQAEKLDPKHKYLLLNMAIWFQQQKQYTEAVTYYLRLIEVAPEEGRVYSDLAMAYFAQKKYSQAYDAAQEALKREKTLDAPNLASLYVTLGSLSMMNRKFETGLDYFQKAVALDPEHPQANANLQRALKLRSQMQRAPR